MLTAHLVGFPQEQGIRLAAALAVGGVYAEPAPRVPNTPAVDVAFVDGTARSHVSCALESWGGRAPACAVALVYPIDALPVNGASRFPPWVDLVTGAGLNRYLEHTLDLGPAPQTRPLPRTVGYTVGDGPAGIVHVEVLGPSGLIFETGRRVRQHDAVTFFIPLGRRSPLAMRGTVVSRRPRLGGCSRCVASFMAATGPQRRALGCLLAGWD
ncbi:MAG: hypothetical protein P1P84_02230 [Deferrisomatales bacterium]|nr:hypothetical protein [Deferrisomatales bacterium]